jgi:hypothetical protein
MMWRAGGLYFAIVFAFAFVFGTVRRFILEPRLGEDMAVAAETPFLIAVMFFSARWITQRIVLSPAQLVGMGVFALVLQQVAELGLVYSSGQAFGGYLAHFSTPAGMIFLAALIVFALMPWLVGLRKK